MESSVTARGAAVACLSLLGAALRLPKQAFFGRQLLPGLEQLGL